MLLAIYRVSTNRLLAPLRFTPIPGIGTPTHGFPILDPNRNLAAWLDRTIVAFTQRSLHTGVLYEHTRDPEGLLSTLPAIATTLLGCVTALWLRRVNATPKARHSDPERAEGEESPHFALVSRHHNIPQHAAC